MAQMEGGAGGLPPRLALLSIAGFWLVYFALLTVRAMAIYHDHLHMLARAIVSVGSMVISYGLYRVMRRVPITPLGPAIAAAALLAIPGTLTYSAFNWLIFDHWRVTFVDVPSPAPRPALPSAPKAMGWSNPASDQEMAMGPIASIADQAVNGYFFFASWAALYLALCYAQAVGALERRAAQLRSAAQAAELRALRYQVNPHFLFNTLNSLSSLVLSGRQEAAERTIMNLATFFRTSLAGDPTEDVRLADEIRLQRLYLDIEAVRFPERLAVAIDLPAALENACVPGLILQPLVENAVKHGVAPARRAVTVRIEARAEGGRLTLSVIDDGGPAGPSDGTHLGLRNVSERLAARYGEAARCKWGPLGQGGFAVLLTMPLVRSGY